MTPRREVWILFMCVLREGGEMLKKEMRDEEIEMVRIDDE